MIQTENEIWQLIEPVCKEDNVYLCKVSLHHGGKNLNIKIIVDTDSGITLNQCQDLSKKISDLFYRKDVFEGPYRLEVSSPGLKKPLEKPYEYS